MISLIYLVKKIRFLGCFSQTRILGREGYINQNNRIRNGNTVCCKKGQKADQRKISQYIIYILYICFTGMFIFVSRERTVFGKCFVTPITEIKTLLGFRCCRSCFWLRYRFTFAFCVYLILTLNKQHIVFFIRHLFFANFLKEVVLLFVCTFRLISLLEGAHFASTGSVEVSSSMTRGESSTSSLSIFETTLSVFCSFGDEVFLLDVSLSLVVDIASDSFFDRSNGCSLT